MFYKSRSSDRAIPNLSEFASSFLTERSGYRNENLLLVSGFCVAGVDCNFQQLFDSDRTKPNDDAIERDNWGNTDAAKFWRQSTGNGYGPAIVTKRGSICQ
jgi:hypothetical protein